MTNGQVTASAPRSFVIACIENHPKAIMLLRIAQRRAHEKGVKWRAVFVETPAHLKQADEGSQERMLRLLTLAKQMGGETAHIEAETLEKGLSQLLEKEGGRVALIVAGGIETEGRFKNMRIAINEKVVLL